jgi:ABC-type nitrate/sulfonate/bicarbonate transport system substrate-binding protein
MVLERSGITRPREMAGCRVQYPGAPGPGGPAIVNTMIQADGGEPGALVPVNHGFFHTNALAEGLADAATLVFYNFEVVEAQHRGLSPRLFALKDWGVPDFCQLILVTLPGTLAAREATMRALVRVMRRGIDFLHQRPAEAAAIYARRTGGAPSALGDAIFAATGVTKGALLDGIRREGGYIITHSLVMNSSTGDVREVRMRRPA